MKATLSLLNRRLVVTAEGADVKQMFRELGQMAEVFECDSQCGACGSLDIRPGFRSVDGFDYYSLCCSACGAQLSLGQRKDGGLFVKRKDEQGRPLPDNGWRKWQQRAIEAAAPEPRRQTL